MPNEGFFLSYDSKKIPSRQSMVGILLIIRLVLRDWGMWCYNSRVKNLVDWVDFPIIIECFTLLTPCSINFTLEDDYILEVG